MPNLQKLHGIEGLRGLAAMLVVFAHAGFMCRADLGRSLGNDVLISGHVGVDLFFVISGFILTYVHFSDFGRPRAVPSYLYKRVCRIYPAMIIMTMFALVTYRMGYKPSSDAKMEPLQIASSFLLLPQTEVPLLGVTWTLKFEILFYAVFALLLANRWLGLTALLFWQGVCLTVGIAGWLLPFPWNFYFAPLALEFLLGVLVAFATFQLQKRPLPGMAIGALVFGLIGVGLLLGTDIRARCTAPSPRTPPSPPTTCTGRSPSGRVSSYSPSMRPKSPGGCASGDSCSCSAKHRIRSTWCTMRSSLFWAKPFASCRSPGRYGKLFWRCS